MENEGRKLEAERRKKWRLSEFGVETLTHEDYERATGFYVGSAYDELGWSPEARCLYSHFIRRASLKPTEMRLWRDGRYERTVKEGMRSIAQWTGLSQYTIEKATKELEELKLITVLRNRQDREVNLYTLLPPFSWCWIKVVNGKEV